MNRVVITGMGIISPIGHNVDTFWKNLANGVSGIGYIENIDASKLAVKIAAEVKNYDPKELGLDLSTIRRTDKYTQFALIAAQQAMDDSKLTVAPERFGATVSLLSSIAC